MHFHQAIEDICRMKRKWEEKDFLLFTELEELQNQMRAIVVHQQEPLSSVGGA
jgi:hypothetical protein